MTPEPECITDCDIDGFLYMPIGDVLQVALRIGMLIIYGWGNEVVVCREYGDDCFDSSCGSKEVTSHRLRRADVQLVSMIAKHCFDCLRFRLIVVGSRRSVGIDVIDAFRFNAGVLHTELHG